MKRIIAYSAQAFSMMCCMTLLLGVIIPTVFTGLSHILFTHAAHGSLISKDDTLIGSEIIGQSFVEPHYFWGRLSATNPPYNAAGSAASNLSQDNMLILEQANERMKALRLEGEVPLSLITASGSGLDPHIPPEAAYVQVERVANARDMEATRLHSLVEQFVEQPLLGFIGLPKVNVLKLNLALDEIDER